MYNFRGVVTLFLSEDELKSDDLKGFLKENKIYINQSNISKGVARCYVSGATVDISFILELEDILDKNITLNYECIGSEEVIRGLKPV